MPTIARPKKTRLERTLIFTCGCTGGAWFANALGYLISGGNESLKPWFGTPLLVFAASFGFTLLLYLARTIEGRFNWWHVTFAISGVVCAPLAMTWFSPPLGNVPRESREMALNIFMTTLVVSGSSTILHLALMIRRNRQTVKTLLASKSGDNKSPRSDKLSDP